MLGTFKSGGSYGSERKKSFSAEQVPVSALCESLKNLKNLTASCKTACCNREAITSLKLDTGSLGVCVCTRLVVLVCEHEPLWSTSHAQLRTSLQPVSAAAARERKRESEKEGESGRARNKAIPCGGIHGGHVGVIFKVLQVLYSPTIGGHWNSAGRCP